MEVPFFRPDDLVTVTKNGQKVTMTYEALCKEFSWYAQTHFVDIDDQGRITFTLGRPEEVRGLYADCLRLGYLYSPKLRRVARGEYGYMP